MTKKIKEKETISVSEQEDKGRVIDFFFPNEMKTIKATSLEEAIEKLKEDK